MQRGWRVGWGATYFFNWSFEHQFNSSSRTLSETIGKWVLLRWKVRILREAIITDKTANLKILIWPTFAYQQQQNETTSHFFWNKRKNLICLHSSTFVHTCLIIRLHSSIDSSTFVYTRLVTPYTRLHSPTFVCDSSTFAYTCLYSSSDSSVFLE